MSKSPKIAKSTATPQAHESFEAWADEVRQGFRAETGETRDPIPAAKSDDPGVRAERRACVAVYEHGMSAAETVTMIVGRYRMAQAENPLDALLGQLAG